MINNVVLVGRLTKDVELRYTQSGIAVASFTVAVERRFKNQQGERETDFILCVMWRKSAENFAKFTRKGSLVGIEGSIQTRNYENNQGQRVYVTEVLAENFSLLEPKSVTESRPSSGDNYQNNFNDNQYFGGNQQQGNNFQQQNNDPFASLSNQSSSSQNGSSHNYQPDNEPVNPYAGNNDGNQEIDITDDDLPF
ncbi:single-stranded DNA-binding protein [Aerococcus urinaehominis]|uniref:Single-stranded DNA-binding protein n=1 Tax=Aerococcus urinaehominis TaxID=128944 RepID=A0A0X8FL48_9LACT|nr:single-stranded DNA-binding protein [Aerococcus urinaehominis]AMB99328.1 single-stranded DNA-binding protein [Aerococcus urinaehominis]SDM20596.1 single-strand DNA-binding protein [Aerococcus urinaehominis]